MAINRFGLQCHRSFTTWRYQAFNIVAIEVVIIGIDSVQYYPMQRRDDYFTLELAGDFHLKKYYLLITQPLYVAVCCDPWALGVDFLTYQDPKTQQELHHLGIIIDFSRTLQIPNSFRYQGQSAQSLIYEASVRDISSSLDLPTKRTFQGVTNPIFLNHLKKVGYSHLQLLPINAFANDKWDVDDYNWGYNPLYYLAPHPKYAKNGFEAINDLKAMIATLHQHKIGLVVDLVFNHVFDYQHHPLNIMYPNYFFRQDDAGKLTNYSGCGNDLDSSKQLAYDLFEQTLELLINEYHVDGFRFDLMGLLDLSCMEKLFLFSKNLKPSIIFYGEGWDMVSKKNNVLFCTINNASLTRIGFFNDYFRSSALQVLGSFEQSTILNLLNGSLDHFNQNSINYLACHDGSTLFDKMMMHFDHHFTLNEKLYLLYSLMLFSKGAALIQLGDDFKRTKRGHLNTYNEGDWINQVDYHQIKNNQELITMLASLAKLRQKIAFNQGTYQLIADLHYLFQGQKTYHLFINKQVNQIITFIKPLKMIFNGRIIVSQVQTSFVLAQIGFYLFQED
ncbi:MAG: hypothetical protein LBV55_00665 [Acholeplasmatales bacterium]|nr:hypothetical protein [Acholeplasmatales bacterium]